MLSFHWSGTLLWSTILLKRTSNSFSRVYPPYLIISFVMLSRPGALRFFRVFVSCCGVCAVCTSCTLLFRSWSVFLIFQVWLLLFVCVYILLYVFMYYCFLLYLLISFLWFWVCSTLFCPPYKSRPMSFENRSQKSFLLLLFWSLYSLYSLQLILVSCDSATCIVGTLSSFSRLILLSLFWTKVLRFAYHSD